MNIEFDATFFAFVALVLFFGVLWYLKIPAQIGSMLDQRSAAIGKELAEAKKLREQAAALLVEYQAKKAAAERQAQDIVSQARTQAAAVAAETRTQLAEALKRREQDAVDKIARAEASALAEVRAAAAEAAMAAAEQILRKELTAAKQAELITKGAAELAKKFA
jgi:F-type H+-transporting ATPase subunit b